MKTAIISVTGQGAELGQRIKQQWLHHIDGDAVIDIYEKEGRQSEIGRQYGNLIGVHSGLSNGQRVQDATGSQEETSIDSDQNRQGIIDTHTVQNTDSEQIVQGAVGTQGEQSLRNNIFVFSRVSPLMEGLMSKYDRLLFIMATGIVVRLMAPYIKHKSVDPAVVVMDEQGHFAISLLSGHLGGANEWASHIAQIAGATPVITTATDVNGLPAPDVLARKLRCEVADFSILKSVNAAIVAKEPVEYYLDDTLYFTQQYAAVAQQMGIAVQRFNPFTVTGQALCQAGGTDQARVIITDLVLPGGARTLFLRPKTITLGIGCRRGTAAELIKEAIADALGQVERSIQSVLSVGSVTVKADEAGLLKAVEDLQLPIHFHTPEAIEHIIQEQGLEESIFVKKTIGVGNVCETTALLEAKSQTLLLKKTKYQGITIAIAQVQ